MVRYNKAGRRLPKKPLYPRSNAGYIRGAIFAGKLAPEEIQKYVKKKFKADVTLYDIMSEKARLRKRGAIVPNLKKGRKPKPKPIVRKKAPLPLSKAAYIREALKAGCKSSAEVIAFVQKKHGVKLSPSNVTSETYALRKRGKAAP